MANNVFIGTDSTWTTASNWSTGAAPIATETVFLTAMATNLTASLNQASILLSRLNLDMSFTGQTGVNSSLNAYTYLQIGATVASLGLPAPGNGTTTGTRLFNWDAGTNSSTINIINTASAGTAAGQAPVKLLGSALTINLVNGIISVAAKATETATVTALNVEAGPGSIAPQAYLGPGCTLTTLNQQGAGAVTSASQALVTTATVAGANASFTHLGTAGIGALSIYKAGNVTYSGSGSINTMYCAGTLDCTGGGSAFTIGSCTLTLGTKILDPLRRITFTNPPVLQGCTLNDITVNRGTGGAF